MDAEAKDVPTQRGSTRSMRFLATALVAVLIGLLLANSVATLYVRGRVSSSQGALDQRLLPAQTQVSHLESAYIDEETGERGYLLTGNPVFLQPYTQGEVAATHLQRRLASLLAGDVTSTSLLRQVIAAHDAWRQQNALPEIAARRTGPLSQSQMDAAALEGKALFDELRTRLVRLSDRVTSLARAELDSVSNAQLLADVVTAVTVALALLGGALALPGTRRILTLPLERLLAQLRRVAGGDYQEAIEPDGAAELVAMAESAEKMRQSLIQHSEELVRAQRTLTLRSERDRVAADLHDRSIQRMYALGLSLSSIAKRHPELAPTVVPLIDETDRGIRELRVIIFNLSHENEASLRQGIDHIVRESARVLGFTPDLDVSDVVDDLVDEELAQELQTVLREALSNVVRHAHASRVQVTLRRDEHHLSLLVSDDGVGVSGESRGHGLRNMEARAERLGGSFELRPDTTGTTLEWRVPIDESRVDDGDRVRPARSGAVSSRSSGGGDRPIDEPAGSVAAGGDGPPDSGDPRATMPWA